MPNIVEKPTATRSNNLQWSGMCIKHHLTLMWLKKTLRFLLALMAAMLRATIYQSVSVHLNLTYYTVITDQYPNYTPNSTHKSILYNC